MLKYILKRIAMLIPVIIGVSAFIFIAMDLAPGSAVDYLLPADATQEDVQRMEAQLGLDKPLLERYVNYMVNMCKGDLGVSYVTGDSVYESYMQKFPTTLKLSMSAVCVAVLIAIPAGIYAALHAGKLSDNAATVISLLGLSIPNYWLGLMMIIVFSLGLGWLPSGGNLDGWKSMVMPAVAVGAGLSAMIARTTRSSMLDVLNQDYLRTARAKGVPEKVVIWQHAFKNALIPIINAIGIELASCIGGAVVTETVFSWPGVGRLIIDSLNARDIPMVTGCIILKTISISVIMLVVDLLYAATDPRIKAQYAKK